MHRKKVRHFHIYERNIKWAFFWGVPNGYWYKWAGINVIARGPRVVYLESGK